MSAWRSALRSRWALLSLACLVYWLATQALRPMVALRLQDLGSSDALIGVVLGLHSAVTFALAVPGGRALDRFGLRRAMLLGQAGMVAAGLALLGAGAVPVLAAVLVAGGIAELAVWLAMQALVTHAGEGAALRRQVTLFTFTWALGQAIGPAVGSALYEAVGFGAVGMVYAGAGALGLVFGWPLPEAAPSGGEDRPGSVLSSVRTMWGSGPVRAVLLSTFVVLFVYGVRNSFYPLLLQRRGVDVGTIGVLLSVIGATSLLVRLPLPALVRRVGAQRLLVGSTWLVIAAMTVTPWLPALWMQVVACVLTGLGFGVNPPLTVELMAVHTSAQERGLAMGLRVSSNRLSQLVQPIVFGTAASVAGLPFAFAAGGLLLGAIAVAVRPPATTQSRSSRRISAARRGPRWSAPP